MRYIDFDGVILDTEGHLFYDWYKIPNYHELTEEDKIRYVQCANWYKILHESNFINDSLYILKHMDIKNNAILTKIHSLENEGYGKIRFLREKGIKQNIFIVPYLAKKTDVVSALGNILVDDCLANLDDWTLNGGYPMFFNKKENDIDSWGQYNHKGYQRVLRINEEIKK